ncbi:hypothetical protein [Streptomyces sp. NPDC093018]|uniref:hypothetical protein n=1 Tax=Streptomyces sp. NPDC093018 TaxID=3155067 RepID=UPI003443CB04
MLDTEAAETIDWHHPRMAGIAASFSRHDRVAVQRLPKRVEVVRYRVFEGDRLRLLLVDSSLGSANAASFRRTQAA